jgi:hypothetical protein
MFCILGKSLKEHLFFPQDNTVILKGKKDNHDGNEPQQLAQNGGTYKNE